MTAKVHSGIPRDVLRRAERRVLRAAAGCVNKRGWSFEYQHGGLPVARSADALRRLELAIANLRSVRKHQAKQRRKHGK
jgi:hypothetical protein